MCDLDQEKAARNARRFGGAVYQEMETMVEAEKPDGVIICIDMDHHATLAQVAMRRGIPVYTEKPPAPSAAATLAVAQVAAETGMLCMTAFKKRYTTAYTRAKAWIDQFAADDLYAISFDYCAAQYANDTLRGSFLFDFCLHIIDLAGYLFGDVERVFAFVKGPDAYAVSLQFRNGAVGSFTFADGRSFSIPTEEVEITVRGGNFMTVHNSSSWRITEAGSCTEWREPPTFTSAGDSGNDTGHLAEIVDFLAAIREGRTTRSNIYESYKTMVLYEAILASAAGGEAVEVRYEPLRVVAWKETA
ncbi:MAG: 4-carboxy-2-hydroxymuconate-6-semialdehyde dehydrogenase [bacterium ADurb.Bin429]|nr:MAG: 4-carboxy-2-hydroxymuconate-6-semialdehyde dehydrogenase [bacterium ADurb.Bin429]